MRKISLVLLSFLLLLIIVSSSFAQAAPRDLDGDGVLDINDDCPRTFGDASNRGCPLDPTPLPDRDGDGTVDVLDPCPDSGGPASNAGCPEDQTPSTAPTEEAQTPLPFLPTDGRCVLATIGRERVNIREIPDSQGAIVGQLSPFSVYPVHFHILGDHAEDEWWLVDGGWVSGLVVRVAGNCRTIPMMRLPEPLVVHLGDLGLIFLGDENIDPATVDFPTDQFPPFFVQVCEGQLKISWLLPAVKFCDGSVIPTDQMPSPARGSVMECDGSVLPFGEVEGDGSVMPISSFLIGLLLPAVQMGDGSVMPADLFFGDGSVLPCPQFTSFGLLLSGGSNAAQGATGGGGGGKVSLQDFHFVMVFGDSARYGFIIAVIPQDPTQTGLLLPAVQAIFEADPPDPDMDWTQVGDMLIGQFGESVYLCPAITDGTSQSNAPTTGLEQVGFNPQPEPPAACLELNFSNQG